MNKAIFTDRDGVITDLVNRNGELSTAQNRKELKFLPGVREGVAQAHLAGFKVFVVSNQPTSDWIVNDHQSQQDWLSYIDSVLRHTFHFDGVMCALDRGSRFYKPNPGMILDLAEAHEIDLSKSWMIGDRWKDCVAAYLAGVKYAHIRGEDPIGIPWISVKTFYEAVQSIIRQYRFEEKLRD